MSIDAMKQALGALEKLWQIIDDIDTASDMAKDNDVWYRQRVGHLQQTRWQLGITTDGYKLDGGAIAALRAAIEQAQKPVAWMYVNEEGECDQIDHVEKEPMPDDPSITPLYTAPRQWQGLTDEEIMEPWPCETRLEFARAIEAKLKEKNT